MNNSDAVNLLSSELCIASTWTGYGNTKSY